MTIATGTISITRRSSTPSNDAMSGVPALLVRECIPVEALCTQKVPPRCAYVSKPNDALGLSWVEKLPGEKRIQFVYGQMFVVQRYLGVRLVRAHICRHEGGAQTARATTK